MSPSDGQGIEVLAAGYDSSSTAISDFEAIDAARDKSHASQFLDAAVINPQDPDLASRTLRTTVSKPDQNDADRPGLASRIGHYLLEGFALVGGEAGGGDQELPADAQGSSSGDVLRSDDLVKLGAVQRASSFTLIVVFSASLSDRVATALSTTNSYTTSAIHATAQQLKDQVVGAERRSIPDHNS